MIREDIARTISVLRELAEGKELHLPNGQVIAMGEDASIGFLYTDADGDSRISGLATIDFKQLNDLLEKHKLGYAIA